MGPPTPAFVFTTSPSIPPSLTLTRKDFITTHPPLVALLASALVFRHNPSTHALETLILRRAPNDSYPFKWEKPGGSASSSDASVLHSVARELWEETGLRAKHMVCPVGIGASSGESEGLSVTGWGIDPEIEKAEVMEGDDAFTVSLWESGGLWGCVTVIVDVEEDLRQEGIVKVTPDEHVEWAWVSEEEVRRGRDATGRTFEFIGLAVWRVLLEGFRLRKEIDLKE